jgi:Ca-activated chloride channel family protein
MKTKFALLIIIALAFVMTGCGGNEAVNESYNNTNTVGDFYYNTGETSFEYDDAAPEVEETWEEPAPQYEPVESGPSDYDFDEPEYNEEIGGYENTRYDHLSTFGIDVDTASYTRTRNYIEDGYLPPAESVRVEEFINYFDAGYPTPEDIAFGIYADGALSPFHSQGTYLLRFGIQGYEVPEVLRKPVSLTFVIDISGSMSDPNKLELVKDSLQLLVDRLDRDDTVSIVVYGTNAKVVLEPTRGDQKRTINRSIERLNTGGSTNAEEGLRMGYNLAYQIYQPGSVNRVILASDGVANVGRTEASELLRFIKDYANTGITLTAMGFGMGTFNDPFMEELADNGDGSYAYIDDLNEAKRLFVDELTSTLQVIARDARIQVDFNPEVVSYYRLLGYENREIADEDFRNDSVDAGEIGAGHSVTALYAVQLELRAQGRIATVQLRWEDPDTRRVVEINGNYNTWDIERDFSETDPHFRLAVIASQFAEILRQSPYSSELEIDDLLKYAYPLSREMPDDPSVNEFIWLLQEAGYLVRW